jgi:menaquinone-dependent protoporphyrinogen oxidase
MSRILVAYGTTEGQTRRIAGFIGERLQRRGHTARVIDSASPEAAQVQPVYDGVIAGGSLHQGRHQGALAHFIRDNLDWMRGLPRAFFSVSLAMASKDADEIAEARRLAQQFVDDTGLEAGMVRCFAGALLYTKYDWLKRMLMKSIAKKEGGEVDASRDWEYTDWSDVSRFVDEYLAATALAGAKAPG